MEGVFDKKISRRCRDQTKVMDGCREYGEHLRVLKLICIFETEPFGIRVVCSIHSKNMQFIGENISIKKKRNNP